MNLWSFPDISWLPDYQYFYKKIRIYSANFFGTWYASLSLEPDNRMKMPERINAFLMFIIVYASNIKSNKIRHACQSQLQAQCQEEDMVDAVKYARIITDPLQKRFPDELFAAYREGIASWEQGDHERSVKLLTEAGDLARKHHYL